MGQLVSFLKSKPFVVHLAVSLISVLVILWMLVKSLSSYTDHGEFVVVPDFSEKAIAELESFAADKGIQYLIVDSIYDPSRKPGVVIKQDPYAESKVKHNRTVYLYVTSMVAPQIQMPKLIDRSERQARLLIVSYGLKAGKITTRSADCNGCVLAQLHKGKQLLPGEPVKKGSVIDLVIGVKEGAYMVSDSLNGDANKQTPSFDEE